MFTNVISTPVSPFYLVAIPYGPRICFEVCAPAYEAEGVKVLMYGSLTQTSEHVGGILVIKEAYHPMLIERHHTYESARQSFEFWVNHFNDPRSTQATLDDSSSPDDSVPVQFGSNIWASGFSNLSARRIDSDAMMELKFIDEPMSYEVIQAFQQQRDWRDILLIWASTNFGEFTPLYRSSDYEAASRASRLFLEHFVPESDIDAPF